MAEKQFLTKKGYDERVARLEELKVVRRKEVAQKLKEAREQGDLSENAEYDAAKDEQRDIETEIAELEAILANCEVIQDNDKNKDVVKMESVVVLHDVESMRISSTQSLVHQRQTALITRFLMSHHLVQLLLERRRVILLR